MWLKGHLRAVAGGVFFFFGSVAKTLATAASATLRSEPRDAVVEHVNHC